jgi:fermentation-respiration switch protein FrsA (DUF1100 family)
MRSAVVFIGLALAAAALFLVVVWLFQRRLIYYPYGAVPPVSSVLPDAEEVSFSTEDGVRLGGWFLPRAGASSAWTAIVFNGNAGNRADRASIAAGLAARGLSVLLFDYSGYGGNAGTPTESGLLLDARAARSYVEGRSEVDAARIVYFGESLGAAVAIGLAAERPPAALVLRSPFSSLAEVARVHYPFLPAELLLRERYPSRDRIAVMGSPLFVIAGTGDSVVPYDQSRALFDAAQVPTKRFLTVEGADHNDLELVSGERVLDDVVDFLKALSEEDA